MKTQLLEDIGESHSHKAPAPARPLAGGVSPVSPALSAPPDPGVDAGALPETAPAAALISPLMGDIEAELALLSALVDARPEAAGASGDAEATPLSEPSASAPEAAHRVWKSRPTVPAPLPPVAAKVWRQALAPSPAVDSAPAVAEPVPVPVPVPVLEPAAAPPTPVPAPSLSTLGELPPRQVAPNVPSAPNGRRAAMLSAAVLGVALLGGAGYWLQQGSAGKTSQAILLPGAKPAAPSAPAVAPTVAPAVAPAVAQIVAPVGTPPAAETEPPPMVLLEERLPPAAATPVLAAAPAVVATAPVKEVVKEAVKPAARAPVKKAPKVAVKAQAKEQDKAQAKPRDKAPAKALVKAQNKAPARAPAKAVDKLAARTPSRPAPAAPERAPVYDMAETLRQCRAAGYHNVQCIERKCVATKFGLACRG